LYFLHAHGISLLHLRAHRSIRSLPGTSCRTEIRCLPRSTQVNPLLAV